MRSTPACAAFRTPPRLPKARPLVCLYCAAVLLPNPFPRASAGLPPDLIARVPLSLARIFLARRPIPSPLRPPCTTGPPPPRRLDRHHACNHSLRQ